MDIVQVLNLSLEHTVNVRRKSWEPEVYLAVMRKEGLKSYIDEETLTWEDLLAYDWELNPVWEREQVETGVRKKLLKVGFIIHQDCPGDDWKVGFNLKNTKGYIDHNRSEWSDQRLCALEDLVSYLAKQGACWSHECNSFTYEIRDKDKCRELLLSIGLKEQEPAFSD